METQNKTRHISDSILTEIQARLPLRSISRFKSVGKAWKSTLESDYFRGHFVSLHQKSSSSSSWSLMYRGSELLSFHGCKTWGLSKSLASYNDLPLNTNNTKLSFSNGMVLIEENYNGRIFVGNPVLKQWFQLPPIPQWFQIPPTRYESASRTYRLAKRFGFVTRADENGVVLDFKVVRLAGRIAECKEGVKSAYLDLLIYSSETGRWTSKKICSLHYEVARLVMNLNGTLYLSSKRSLGPPDHEGVLIAHDFFSDSDQCRVIRLPDYDLNYKWDSKRALTTSLGSVIYIKVLADQKGDNLLKIWRLNNDDDCWELFSEILVSFDANDYAPVAMHPFDGNIAYLWSQEKRHLVSCNLRTQSYKVLGNESTRHNDNDHDHQDCLVNQSLCENYMDDNSQQSSISEYRALIQFTLPRWMKSMPRPPQVEEETNSLLSRKITSERDRRRPRRL